MDVILNNIILAKIKKQPNDFTAYEDLFSICRSDIETHKKEALQYSTRLREICEQNIRKLDGDIIPKLIDLVRRTLLFEAPHLFDSYMLYLEINRKPNERFYKPRRKKTQNSSRCHSGTRGR